MIVSRQKFLIVAIVAAAGGLAAYRGFKAGQGSQPESDQYAIGYGLANAGIAGAAAWLGLVVL